MTNKEKGIIVEINLTQKAFLDYCKEFGWGVLEVRIKNGEPVFATVLKKEVKFD